MRHSFIDPNVLASIARLPLVAKTVVDGFMLGMHQSQQSGAGLEFNQYRSYEPGDDLRRIDWKLFARSDRYYVRDAVLESSITVRFILDGTASMLHEENGLTKFDYGRILVASLGYLAQTQGDRIGLQIIRKGGLTTIPAHNNSRQIHRFFHQLEETVPGGAWPSPKETSRAFSIEEQRSIVVFVSDMHEMDEELTETISLLRTNKNDVIVFHLVGGKENTFDYTGTVTFEDLETGQRVLCDANAVRRHYLEAQKAYDEKLRRHLYEHQIAYERYTMNQPLDFALRHFLSRRAKIAA